MAKKNGSELAMWPGMRRRAIVRRTPLHFGSGVHVCGEADLNHRPLGIRPDSPFDESRTVPTSTKELAIQSLRLPPPFRGLGSVLPYR